MTKNPQCGIKAGIIKLKWAVLAGKFFRTKSSQGRPTGKRPILLSKIFTRCTVSQCHPQGGEESQQKMCVGLNSKKRDISMVASIRCIRSQIKRFKCLLHCQPLEKLFAHSQYPPLNCGDNNMTYFRGLLGGLKQLI